MNVADLIEKLSALPPELEVIAWDDETQVVVGVKELAEVRVGEFGHDLTLSESGTPALLLLNDAQGLDTVMENIAEMGAMMASLEGDPTRLHGKHSLGIVDREGD
ncbi:hypothetical protein [Endothiovibrio diazotrophicus]